MEFGAIFILVILLVVVGVLCGGLYAVSMWLRGKKLAPQADQAEGKPQEERSRPEHVEVENEQRARFVGSR
jgi:flagellar basal body-associated protein FliL